MIGIRTFCLYLGGGVALISCAVAIPMSLSSSKNPTEHQMSAKAGENESLSSFLKKEQEIKEGLKQNWEKVEIKWKPFCGVAHSSLCLI